MINTASYDRQYDKYLSLCKPLMFIKTDANTVGTNLWSGQTQRIHKAWLHNLNYITRDLLSMIQQARNVL